MPKLYLGQLTSTDLIYNDLPNWCSMQWIRIESTTFIKDSHANKEDELFLTSMFQYWAHLFECAKIQYVNWKRSVNNIPALVFLCNITKNEKLRNKPHV